MSQPTLQQVYDEARAYLSDLAVAGGESWPNYRLQPHLGIAARELQDAMGAMQLPRARRDGYLNLPANTSRLIPSVYGFSDIFEPEFVRERGIATTVSITSTNTASPIQVTTAAPHGLSTGQEIIVSQVSGTSSPLGRWLVNVVDASNLLLNGSLSDGLVGAGGFCTTSTEDWSDELSAQDDLTDRLPTTALGEYSWKNGMFYLVGATTNRQIWIGYIASGTLPSLPSQPIGIDNCDGYLACRTAALASNSVREYTFADRLNRIALGPTMEADGSGGLLRSFISAQVLTLQREQHQRGPFRAKRTDATFGWM